jgi:hypothetical protein
MFTLYRHKKIVADVCVLIGAGLLLIALWLLER